MSVPGWNSGELEMQEHFDSRRLADAIRRMGHEVLTERDRDFIEGMDMFFLASVDDRGNVDCSYKGGDPGFVRVVDERTLAWPNYDGNGMFNSTGNIRTNGKVGMLFIDFVNQWRMRVNGTASIHWDDPLMEEFPGAQFIIRVHTEDIFGNCPRYIHKMELVERSKYVPRAECETPDATWKDHFDAELPADQRARRAASKSED